MMDHLDIACDIEIKEEPLEEHGKKIKLESEFSSADDTQSEESSVVSKKIKLETKEEGLPNDSGAIFSQVGILKSLPQEFEEYQIQQQENLSEEKNYELQIQLQNLLTNGATKFEEQREVDNERASSSNVNPKGLNSGDSYNKLSIVTML
ncbi:hypothetical protein Avbf_10071 [Armadillidium vulgare]|nr:hypothetical protein Avbf_10071 [Armadillidium vulgare]